jgi:CelD/BcsL family acetyltransferase involved in cellulose biosynthesis
MNTNSSTKSLILEEVQDGEQFLKLKKSWNDLIKKDSESTFFQLWEWNYFIWQHVERYHSRLCILKISLEDGSIVGIVPFCVRMKKMAFVRMAVLQFIGERHLNYKIPIIDDAYREKVLESVVEWIHLSPLNWDVVDLEKVSWNEEGISVLKAKLEKYFVKPLITEDERSPFLKLLSSTDVWSNLSDQSFVRYLKRKLKKIEKDFTCRFMTVQNERELAQYFPVFVQLHKMRSHDKLQIGTFRDKKREQFFTCLLENLFKLNKLHFHFLLLNEHPVAGLMNFEWDCKIYFFQSGFDLSYRKYSLGHIMHYYAIQYALQNGDREYDFLNGYELYKTQWTSNFRQLYRIQIIRSKWKYSLFVTVEKIRAYFLNNKLMKKIYFLLHH